MISCILCFILGGFIGLALGCILIGGNRNE